MSKIKLYETVGYINGTRFNKLVIGHLDSWVKLGHNEYFVNCEIRGDYETWSPEISGTKVSFKAGGLIKSISLADITPNFDITTLFPDTHKGLVRDGVSVCIRDEDKADGYMKASPYIYLNINMLGNRDNFQPEYDTLLKVGTLDINNTLAPDSDGGVYTMRHTYDDHPADNYTYIWFILMPDNKNLNWDYYGMEGIDSFSDARSYFDLQAMSLSNEDAEQRELYSEYKESYTPGDGLISIPKNPRDNDENEKYIIAGNIYLYGDDIAKWDNGTLKFGLYKRLSGLDTSKDKPEYKMELGRDVSRMLNGRTNAYFRDAFINWEGSTTYNSESTSYVSHIEWYSIPLYSAISPNGFKGISVTGEYHPNEIEVVFAEHLDRQVTRTKFVPLSDNIAIPDWADSVSLVMSKQNKDMFDAGKFKVELRVVVTPVYKTLKKVKSRESDQMFFRETLEGNIKLIGHDYYLIRQHDIVERLSFHIYERYCNGLWYEYFRGYFTKGNCKMDYGKKTVTISPKPLDQYTDILTCYEDKYNLTELGVAYDTVRYYSMPALQTYEEGSTYITTISKGVPKEESVDATYNPDGKTTLVDMGFARSFGTECIMDVQFSAGSEYKAKYDGTYRLSGKVTITQTSSDYEASFTLSGGKGPDDAFDGFTISTTENSYRITFKPTGANTIVTFGSTQGTEFPRLAYSDFCVRASDERIVVQIPGLCVCVIRNILPHRVWTRMLTNKTLIDGTETKELTASDISYKRNYKYALPWSLPLNYTSYYTTDSAMSKYGRNDFDCYFSTERLPALSTGEYVPVNKTQGWTITSQWLEYGEDVVQVISKGISNALSDLRDAMPIYSVIQCLLNKYGLNLTHKGEKEYSTFLYGFSTLTQPNLTKSNDYVQYSLFITPISNILVGNYDTAARKAELSLKNVLDMLCKCFKVYWYIEDGMFKLEHSEFFAKGGRYNKWVETQIDLTAKTDSYNNKLSAYFQTELEYETDKLPRKYVFDWGCGNEINNSEQTSLSAISDYIDNDNTEQVTVANFSGDLDAQILQSSSFSNDGFSVLMAYMNQGIYTVPLSTVSRNNTSSQLVPEMSQNYLLEWAELADFYLYDAPAPKMYCNKRNMLIAKTLAKTMTHEVSFKSYEEIDTSKVIITDVGSGFIDKVETDIATKWVTVTLKYQAE